MENKTLIVFKALPDDTVDKAFVLSSLQDFEGSLLLASDGRWPSALMLLWSSCEKMMKASICITNGGDSKLINRLENLGGEDIQTAFDQINRNLSLELKNSGKKLRKLRNKVAHKGSSPEDDFKCINAFFRGGISYFEACLKSVTGLRIREAIGNEGLWFWRVYENTRKGVYKFSPDSIDLELRRGMFFLSSAVKKCLSINSINQYIHGVKGCILPHVLDGSHGDIEFEARKTFHAEICSDLLKSGIEICPAYVNKRDDKTGILIESMDFECPICAESDAVIGFKSKEVAKNQWEFASIESFCCFNELCTISAIHYHSSVFLEVFFHDVLTHNVKKFLAKEGGEIGYNMYCKLPLR